jgi:membrane-associated protease RseP (regulator of RpoE activity)
MKHLFIHSEDERRASVTGMNIFFGALLGVNLGAFNDLELRDYASLAFLLGGAVAGLFIIAVSRRRAVVVSMVLLYAGLLTALMLNPSLRPERMDEEIGKIIATLAIWLFFILIVRITPARKDPVAVTATPPERLIEED